MDLFRNGQVYLSFVTPLRSNRFMFLVGCFNLSTLKSHAPQLEVCFSRERLPSLSFLVCIIWHREIRNLTDHLPRSGCDAESFPRPSISPLLDPKCPLFGTIYPYLRVQGGSWSVVLHQAPSPPLDPKP